MEPHERTWTRLPLDGAFNVRELGGYPTLNGNHTKYRQFLRSDGLSRLSDNDVRFLRDYGVRAVIDLRDSSEVDQCPDVSLGSDVAYVNIPLLEYNAAEAEALQLEFGEETFSMEVVYRRILEHYQGVRACFRFIAEVPQGCVLFHCAMGKDRTGILAMLLLSLAGVDKWDVVADYVQTWPNLMRDPSFREDWFDPKRSEFRSGMSSDPSLIEFSYDIVEEEHHGVESYLLECGVPDKDAAKVRQRLLAER